MYVLQRTIALYFAFVVFCFRGIHVSQEYEVSRGGTVAFEFRGVSRLDNKVYVPQYSTAVSKNVYMQSKARLETSLMCFTIALIGQVLMLMSARIFDCAWAV